MKKILYMVVLALFIYSCGEENVNNNNNKEKVSEAKVAEKKKELSWEEKIDSMLNALGIKTRNWDSIVHIICDTSFNSHTLTNIQLDTQTCPFKPDFLVVSDYKLQFLNSSFDSMYVLKTNFQFLTASWSPFKSNEAYVLVKDNIKIPDSKEIEYCSENLFNLGLYKLNLDSMQMQGVTTFYDKSPPLCRLCMELGAYFTDTSFVKIDTANNMIYYDCVAIGAPADGAEYFATYNVDLEKGTTSLGRLIDFAPKLIYAKDIPLYSTSYLKYSKMDVQKEGEYIVLSKIPDNRPAVKIPISLLYEEPLNLPKQNSKEALGYLYYNLCFTPDNKMVICSPCREEEMGILNGNIYLLDLDGNKLKTLVKGEVIGYEVSLKRLKNGMYLLDVEYGKEYNGELYLFDGDFNLVRHFEHSQYYEFL